MREKHAVTAQALISFISFKVGAGGPCALSAQTVMHGPFLSLLPAGWDSFSARALISLCFQTTAV